MSLESALEVDQTSTSPQIAPHPKGKELRLIDNGLLHYEASLAGYAERYGRGETSHTIHVWWARRPHSAMRALVFASLCKNTSRQADEVLKALPFNDPSAIMKARALLKFQYGGQPPRLLDMFGGGGTIPSESANLGAETYSIDSNEMSVFIQRCNLVYSQSAGSNDIQSLLRASGTRVIEQLSRETDPLFPLRKKNLAGYEADSVYGYFWTYSIACPSCAYKMFLIKRPWLSRKKGKNLAFVIQNSKSKQELLLQKCPENYKIDGVFVGRNGSIQCPKCKETHSSISIKKCSDEVIALLKPAKKTGKEFLAPIKNAMPTAEVIKNLEAATLRKLKAKLPESELPRWSGIVNPSIYGVETHADFVNPRQRLVLLLLIKALRDEHERLQANETKELATYIIGLLSSLIDQLVDWNCRLSMWIPQNEQVGRAFCGPGVSMLWDYIEMDSVLNGPANLWSKLDRIVTGAASISNYPCVPHVQKAYAQDLPFPDKFFDAVVTDPPYYDNIYYNVLADFFYSWKKILLSRIEPSLFSGVSTDCSRELVASKFRSKTVEKAHSDYCIQLTLALCEADRVMKDDGVFSFVYSHSSLRGWEAIVRAFRATSFRITSVQPLSIERKARPRAISSDAINTCITFVAHKTQSKRLPVSIIKLKMQLQECCAELAPQLLAVNWTEEDAALAVFANGVAMLVNAQRVTGTSDDIAALEELEATVHEKFPSFSVQNRGSI